MTRTITPAPLVALCLLLASVLPAQRLWVGMPVTSIPMESQLSRGLPPDFVWDGLYLVEFNGTRFADTGTESGQLNQEYALKQWDAFRASPPALASKLVFLQFLDNFPVLHAVELAGWDGRMEVGGSPEVFQLTMDPEMRYHNTFIYLKAARQARAQGNLIQAKAYIERIFVLDPRSTEVPQARELQVQIEAEERRLELERLLARADVARCEKRLEEAIALYKEALDKYGPQADAEKALKATQAELEARLKAAEEARREVEAQRAKEEERERLAREQARVEAEAKREAAVQAEATDRRQEVKALLNQARLLREKGKLQEAAEAVQAAGRLDPDNPQVEAEARELRLAVAGQKLQEARGAKQAGRKGEALRLLNDAREWDPNNKVIEMELGLLRQSIAPGEADGMDTAELVWAPSRDMRFVITPPASPETEAGKVFLWGGVLDQKVDGAFIVKVGRDHQFCFTAGFPLKGVNFKAGVRVVGEYTGNQTFSTVLDAPVEVPCLKALYVE